MRSVIARRFASSVARGRLLDLLEPERARVLAERGDELVGVLAQRHARLLRPGDGPVVDVGEVHHLPDAVPALVLQRAAQHVEADEGPEVPDVAAVVDREAAGVHADRVVAKRREVLFPTRQGVVEAHHGVGAVVRVRPAGVSSSAGAAAPPHVDVGVERRRRAARRVRSMPARPARRRREGLAERAAPRRPGSPRPPRARSRHAPASLAASSAAVAANRSSGGKLAAKASGPVGVGGLSH